MNYKSRACCAWRVADSRDSCTCNAFGPPRGPRRTSGASYRAFERYEVQSNAVASAQGSTKRSHSEHGVSNSLNFGRQVCGKRRMYPETRASLPRRALCTMSYMLCVSDAVQLQFKHIYLARLRSPMATSRYRWCESSVHKREHVEFGRERCCTYTRIVAAT